MSFMTIVFIAMLLLLAGYVFLTLHSAEKIRMRRMTAAPEIIPKAEEKEDSSAEGDSNAADADAEERRDDAEESIRGKAETEKPSAPVQQPVQNAGKSRTPAMDALISVGTLLFVLMGMMDLLGAIDFGPYRGAFALMGITAAAVYLISLVLQKRASRTLRFFGRLLAVAAVLELTLFQFPSYQMMFGGYEEIAFSAVDAVIEKGVAEESSENGKPYVSELGEVILEYPEIEQKIGSIHVDYIEREYMPRLQFKADITDETTDTYRTDIINTTLVNGCEETSYVSCQFSGEVHKLRLKFTAFDAQHTVAVRGITLNAPIPFTVMPVRILLIVVLGTLAYAVVHSALLRRPYAEARVFTRRCTIVLTCGMIALAAAIVLIKLPIANLSEQFSLEGGNQITQELVDAFENGQLSLLEEPAPGLLALENPYDRAARNDSGEHILWDHVLYEGNYYSYYGIAPVLLLFLPYHMITGYYFSTNLAVLLFGIVGIIFLAMTYLAVAKRWFRDVSAGGVLAGLVVLFSVCGIWFSLGRPLFYEISISSGFAFVTMGAYFLISSNVVSAGRTSLVRIVFASLFSGLAVLCRPTLAVYSVCTCLFFLFGFRKAGQKPAADGTYAVSLMRTITYVICALLPLMLLGLLQMWYNYARFDSPLDFGIQYSLTINDFTHAEYHTHFVLIGLMNYLFAVPSISMDYPYISTPFSRLNVSGYYFSDIGNTSGILFLAFPVFAYLLAGKALRRIDSRAQRIQWGSLVGMTCILMPLVIIFSIWESGYAVRYVADFSWQIVIGALAVLFFLYQKSQNMTKKELVHRFMALSAVAAVAINGVQIFNFTFSIYDYPEICTMFDRMIAFWR